MHPDIRDVSAPHNIALNPNAAKSDFLSGAIWDSPPTWMAILPKFAKPHNINDEIIIDFSVK